VVVDPSVLLQILFDEPGAVDAVRTVLAADDPITTAVGALEAEVVWGGRSGFDDAAVATLLARLGVRVVAFEPQHLAEARSAYERFGKGRGHPARLNLGDCVSYAVAKATGRPLAFEGDDFIHTDVPSVRTG
jgi:ribonuclease VapC